MLPHATSSAADPTQTTQAGQYQPVRSDGSPEGKRPVVTAPGPVGGVLAKVIPPLLRWTYRRTGLRPSDEALCRLGRRFSAMHRLPMSMRDGRTLYLDLRNPVSVPYLLEGEFPAERIETELVGELVRPGDLAVDIGANVGWYAGALCRAVGAGGAVHAFEPNPFLAPLLRALSQREPALVVHEAACGARSGERVDFYIPDNWISGSRRAGGDDARRHSVALVRLDGALPAGPDFVKLDAEGGEMSVLAGAGQILDSPEAPIWMVELSTAEAEPFGHSIGDLVERFRSAGRAEYTGYRIDPESRRLHPLTLPEAEEFWINALFVPARRGERLPADWLFQG